MGLLIVDFGFYRRRLHICFSAVGKGVPAISRQCTFCPLENGLARVFSGSPFSRSAIRFGIFSCSLFTVLNTAYHKSEQKWDANGYAFASGDFRSQPSDIRFYVFSQRELFAGLEIETVDIPQIAEGCNINFDVDAPKNAGYLPFIAPRTVWQNSRKGLFIGFASFKSFYFIMPPCF